MKLTLQDVLPSSGCVMALSNMDDLFTESPKSAILYALEEHSPLKALPPSDSTLLGPETKEHDAPSLTHPKNQPTPSPAAYPITTVTPVALSNDPLGSRLIMTDSLQPSPGLLVRPTNPPQETKGRLTVDKVVKYLDDRIKALHRLIQLTQTKPTEGLDYRITLHPSTDKCIVFTGLTDMEKQRLIMCIQQANEHGCTIRLDSQLPSSDSLLLENYMVVTIASDIDGSAALRSPKVYLAMALGVPVVSYQWIEHCLNQKCLIWPSDGLNNLPPDYWIRAGTNGRIVLSHWRRGSSAFQDCLIILIQTPEQKSDEVELLERLITLCAGIAVRLKITDDDSLELLKSSKTKLIDEDHDSDLKACIAIVPGIKDVHVPVMRLTLLKRLWKKYLFDLEDYKARDKEDTLCIYPMVRQGILKALYNDENMGSLIQEDEQQFFKCTYVEKSSFLAQLRRQLRKLPLTPNE